MYDANFKFEPGEKVLDPMGNIGVVIICGVDLAGNLYKVQAGQMVDWYREILLQPCPQKRMNMETKG